MNRSVPNLFFLSQASGQNHIDLVEDSEKKSERKRKFEDGEFTDVII